MSYHTFYIVARYFKQNSIKIFNNLISKNKFKEKKMSNKKLFQDAIVDAKAIREAALLNAKEALEEALTPSIQNMLAAKLNEMNMGDEEMEEGMYPEDTTDEIQDRYRETGAALEEEEFDLSAIVAELEAEEMEEGLNEAKKEEEEETEEEETEEEEGEEEEEIDVKDMSVEDLKALIKDIVSQELEAEEIETPADERAEMGGDEMEMADEEEIDLEELLAELDSIDEYDELEEAKKKKVMKKEEEEKKEMKEAINVINTLRKELNEVNLLNAKLLYVNKIFKSKNLSESQKLNVIASFDKATTPKEAKMVYESLESTLNTAKKKSPIKESLGFASKAAGIAPKKQIVESNDIISRMQKLANIIK